MNSTTLAATVSISIIVLLVGIYYQFFYPTATTVDYGGVGVAPPPPAADSAAGKATGKAAGKAAAADSAADSTAAVVVVDSAAPPAADSGSGGWEADIASATAEAELIRASSGAGADTGADTYTDDKIDVQLKTMYTYFNDKTRDIEAETSKIKTKIDRQDGFVRKLNEDATAMLESIHSGQAYNDELQLALTRGKAELQAAMDEQALAREPVDKLNATERGIFRADIVTRLDKAADYMDTVARPALNETHETHIAKMAALLNQGDANRAALIGTNTSRIEHTSSQIDAHAIQNEANRVQGADALGRAGRIRDHINGHLQPKLRNYFGTGRKIFISNASVIKGDTRLITDGRAGQGTVPHLTLNWGVGNISLGDLNY
jgi:hypothetical protein